jgi:hypothetical protein
MTLAHRNLQSARIIHITFVFAAIGYLVVPFMAAPRGRQFLPFALFLGISAV